MGSVLQATPAWSPTVPQVLPALLQHWLLCRSTGPDRSLHQHGPPTAFVRHLTAPLWGSPWLQLDMDFTMDLHGCRGTAASPGSAPGECREISACPFPLTWVSADFFPSHILLPCLWLLLHCRVFFLLNTLSQRWYRCCWWALPRPAVGLSGSQLGTHSRAHGESF